MTKVSVDIFEEEVEGDYGWCPGLRVICGQCSHYVEVMGTTDRSAARAAAMLRKECPNSESNFYDISWWS